MVRKDIFSRKNDDSAAAAVEFALVLPLLMVFLLGVISYGYIFSMQQTVSEGSAEGARSAAITAIDKSDTKRIESARIAINRTMTSYGLECGEDGLTCTTTIISCPGDSSHRCAEVLVSYDWENNPRVPGLPILPTPDTISHKSIIEVS